MQRREHRRALHWASVIGVQRELAGVDAFMCACGFDEVGGEIGALARSSPEMNQERAAWLAPRYCFAAARARISSSASASARSFVRPADLLFRIIASRPMYLTTSAPR